MQALPPTLRPDIAQRFDCTPMREADFHADAARPGLQVRDLGLRAATGGLMQARHVRATAAGGGIGWHCHDHDFHFLYLLQGTLETLTQDGASLTLRAGDCVHLPALYRHHDIAHSADFAMVEITAPADMPAIVGRNVVLPVVRPQAGRTSVFAVDYDGPQAYKVGEGPRRFLAYRDAAATAATGRRVNINVVRNSQAGDSSTGWHYHTLACQFVHVLRGWSRVEVEGEAGEFLLQPGDSMTIPRGCKHDVTGFSADFQVLELNIPADYDTIACDPPQARPVHSSPAAGR